MGWQEEYKASAVRRKLGESDPEHNKSGMELLTCAIDLRMKDEGYLQPEKHADPSQIQARDIVPHIIDIVASRLPYANDNDLAKMTSADLAVGLSDAATQIDLATAIQAAKDKSTGAGLAA